jgi:hypothetical protein
MASVYRVMLISMYRGMGGWCLVIRRHHSLGHHGAVLWPMLFGLVMRIYCLSVGLQVFTGHCDPDHFVRRGGRLIIVRQGSVHMPTELSHIESCSRR